MEVGGLLGQNPGHTDPKGLGQVSLQQKGSFHSTQGFYPIHPELLHVWEEGPGAALVLHFQEVFVLPLGQLEEKVTPTLQSHIVEVEREAQRWVGVGGQQVHRDGGLHLSEIILTNLGTHG